MQAWSEVVAIGYGGSEFWICSKGKIKKICQNLVVEYEIKRNVRDILGLRNWGEGWSGAHCSVSRGNTM